jgi:hypothetical protein
VHSWEGEQDREGEEDRAEGRKVGASGRLQVDSSVSRA